MEKKCCFTGYRPTKLKFLWNKESKPYRELYELIKTAIVEAIDDGYRYFISGFALGVDLIAAEIVISLRQDYDLFLEAALPCMNQTAGWSNTDREYYYNLLDSVDKKVCLDKVGNRESFLKRNCYMVEESQRIIGVYDGKKGGTKHTIEYARRKGREIVLIDPVSMRIEPREQNLFS